MAPRVLVWAFVKIVVVLTNIRSTKRNSRLFVGYSEICFKSIEFKVLEGLPNLDVQYADLCVGLQYRRRWKLRPEFAHHCNRNGSLKHWYTRRASCEKEKKAMKNGTMDALMLKNSILCTIKKKIYVTQLQPFLKRVYYVNEKNLVLRAH